MTSPAESGLPESETASVSTAPEKTEAGQEELPGFRRNVVWRVFQVIMQLLLVVLLRYRVQGIERYPRDSGALLLINHQSYLDPLLVGLPLKRPVSYLARDSLFRVPIIGWILRNTFVMPINRDQAGTESIRKAIQRTEDGFLVGVFPEGTRTRNGEIGVLKPGFVALARRARVPIIPVGIAGAYRAMPRGSLLVRPARVGVYVGSPLDADRVAELTQKGREQEFVAYVREHLQQCCQQAEEIIRK